MGVGLSVAGFAGLSREFVLQRLALVDTGEEVDPEVHRGFCVADGIGAATGWVLVQTRNCDFFINAERVRALSEGCKVVASMLEEHVMVSGAMAAANGEIVWSVIYGEDAQHPEVRGTAPAIYDAILAEQMRANDDQEGDVQADYIVEAPLALAAAVCGYRPDQGMNGEGLPVFTAAKPVGGASPKKGGLLGFLFR
jgi:hypothetical protein